MKRATILVFALAMLSLAPAAAQTAGASGPAFLALTDVNSASRRDLARLPGVGSELADKIIQGRPYRRKDELVGRNILPQSVYDGIKDRIITGQ